MTPIDPTIPHGAQRPDLADVPPDSTAAGKHAAGVLEMSLENAAYAQGAAARTMAAVQGLPKPGVQETQMPDASPAALNLLHSEVMAIQPFDISTAALMAVAKMNQNLRQANRVTLVAESNIAFAEMSQAIDNKKGAANFRLAAGLVSGFTEVASGAMQLGAGAYSARESAQALKMQGQASDFNSEAQEYTDQAEESSQKAEDMRTLAKAKANASQGGSDVSQVQRHLEQAEQDDFEGRQQKEDARSKQQRAEARQARASALDHSAHFGHTLGEFLSKLSEGTGQLASTGLRHTADLQDIEAQQDEAYAKRHETAAEDAREAWRNNLNVFQEIREQMKSMLQSTSQTQGSVANNMR